MPAPNYEQLTNGPQTTLNGGISSGATSLVVTSATGFPTGGNFRILIGTELFLVTAVSGTTFTVTSGAEGTTQAAHSNGDAVTHILTAGAMAAHRADSLLYDAFGNRPSAGVAGRLFIPTDANIAQYDDGSVWQSIGPLQQLHQPPLKSNFSSATPNNSTDVDDSGTIYLPAHLLTTGWNIVDRYIAKPSTPFTITVNMELDAFILTNSSGYLAGCGIYIRDSSTSRIVINEALFESAIGDPQFAISEFSSFTAVNSDEISRHHMAFSLRNIWMRYTDNGTNRTVSLSNDGQHWTQIDTRAHTYVASSYDQVGFAIAVYNDSNNFWAGTPAVKLRSWKQT
jgi:hypothetical protein